MVGPLPSGLPHLTIPSLDLGVLEALAPGALAIVLVGYAEALGAAKAAALQGAGDVDPNQELVAHGGCNIFSGLLGGFLVVGSLSKTSVAMAADDEETAEDAAQNIGGPMRNQLLVRIDVAAALHGSCLCPAERLGITD